MTIEEQERYAHANGDTALAAALAQVIDLENEAADLRAAVTDAELTIEHLKRMTFGANVRRRRSNSARLVAPDRAPPDAHCVLIQ